MKKRLWRLLSVGIFLGFSSSGALACKCMVPKGPIEEMITSHSVFVGTVQDITMVKESENTISSVKGKKVSFNIEEVFKWDTKNAISITTADDSATCGFNFEKGEKYIVYTHNTPEWEKVSLCSRTTLLNDAEKDIKLLSTTYATKERFEKDYATNCKLATDSVNDFKNIHWQFVIITKKWYTDIFTPDWSCKEQIEPWVCTREYTPVCGVNGITYGNSCTAGLVKISYTWECVGSLSNTDIQLYTTIQDTLPQVYQDLVHTFVKNHFTKYDQYSYKRNEITSLLITRITEIVNYIMEQAPQGVWLSDKTKTLYDTLLLLKFELTKSLDTNSYNQDSWEILIPETCNTFNDGCNICSRMGSTETAMCTKMACERYERPYCMDS